MKKLLLAVSLLYLHFGFSQDFNANAKQLDTLLNYYNANSLIMGNLAINQDGETLYTNSPGYRDVASRISNDKYTAAPLGNISELFISTLILQLTEEGKINLDSPIVDFYPELSNFKGITVNDLLTHKSGLPNIPQHLRTDEFHKSREQQEIEALKKASLHFNPGKQSTISNADYFILLKIIEKVTGKSFKSVLQQYILNPLALKQTRFGTKAHSGNNEAYDYHRANGVWEHPKTVDSTLSRSEGGIISTARDLAQFLHALFKGKLLSDSSLQKLSEIKKETSDKTTPFIFKDKQLYHYSGKIGDYITLAVYFPEEKTAITLTLNALDPKVNLHQFFVELTSIYFGYNFDLAPFRKPVNPDRFTGLYRREKGDSLSLKVENKHGFLTLKEPRPIRFGISSLLNETPGSFFSYDKKYHLEFIPKKGILTITSKEGKQYILKKEIPLQ